MGQDVTGYVAGLEAQLAKYQVTEKTVAPEPVKPIAKKKQP